MTLDSSTVYLFVWTEKNVIILLQPFQTKWLIILILSLYSCLNIESTLRYSLLESKYLWLQTKNAKKLQFNLKKLFIIRAHDMYKVLLIPNQLREFKYLAQSLAYEIALQHILTLSFITTILHSYIHFCTILILICSGCPKMFCLWSIIIDILNIHYTYFVWLLKNIF